MREELSRRFAELNDEIRRYPGPIARCDEQLAALLEQRARLLARIDDDNGCSALALWTNDGGSDAA